jgi:hypothetical protein
MGIGEEKEGRGHDKNREYRISKTDARHRRVTQHEREIKHANDTGNCDSSAFTINDSESECVCLSILCVCLQSAVLHACVCFVLCPPALRTAIKCSLHTRTGRIGTARHCASMSAGDSEADDDDDNEDDVDEEEDKEEEDDDAVVGDKDEEAAAVTETAFAAAAELVSVARSAIFSRTNCACDSLSAARLASRTKADRSAPLKFSERASSAIASDKEGRCRSNNRENQNSIQKTFLVCVCARGGKMARVL